MADLFTKEGTAFEEMLLHHFPTEEKFPEFKEFWDQVVEGDVLECKVHHGPTCKGPIREDVWKASNPSVKFTHHSTEKEERENRPNSGDERKESTPESSKGFKKEEH
ncbi:MAG: hypothetical protein Q9159_005538 [Coniocarpon cinnabarinum]